MCRRGNAPRPKLRSLTRKLKKAKAILCLRTKHLNAHVFGAAVVEGVAEARPQKGVVARGQSSQQLDSAVETARTAVSTAKSLKEIARRVGSDIGSTVESRSDP